MPGHFIERGGYEPSQQWAGDPGAQDRAEPAGDDCVPGSVIEGARLVSVTVQAKAADPDSAGVPSSRAVTVTE